MKKANKPWSIYDNEIERLDEQEKIQLLITVVICALSVLVIIGFVASMAGKAYSATIESAVYHESRNQSLDGQVAVALVILWRTESASFPNTEHGVINQPYQFSHLYDDKPDFIDDERAYNTAIVAVFIARALKARGLAQKMTHYHLDSIQVPWWAHKLKKVAVIGGHIFYE